MFKNEDVTQFVLAVLAGIFLIITVNFESILGRLFSPKEVRDIVVEGISYRDEINDIAVMNFEVKCELATSAQLALKTVTEKADSFTKFLKSLPKLTVSAETPYLTNEIVDVGGKKAINYIANLSIRVQLQDLSQIESVVKKAADLEITTRPAGYLFSTGKAKEIRNKLFEPTLTDGLEKAKAQAKESGLKLISSTGTIQEEQIRGVYTDERDAFLRMNSGDNTTRVGMILRILFQAEK